MLIGWRTDLAVSASNVGEQDANRAHVALAPKAGKRDRSDIVKLGGPTERPSDLNLGEAF